MGVSESVLTNIHLPRLPWQAFLGPRRFGGRANAFHSIGI